MHATVDDFKSKRSVRIVRFFVVDQGIRGHFEAASRTGPIFSRLHQISANTLASKRLTNKPAFDKSNRTLRIAAVSMRAQPDLKKAGQCLAFSLRYQDGAWQASRRTTGKGDLGFA